MVDLQCKQQFCRLKEKSDELAKCVDKYSTVEEMSTTTSKLAMQLAAELFARVGDEQ
jgi:hypothetical protein